MEKRILLVEDEEDIRTFIELNLRNRGFEVSACASGEAGLSQALHHPYDLIILDWMLPEIEGIEICKRLRQADNYTSVLMLTAKDTEIDRIIGLEMGADDYLAKPFSLSELEARVKALLRRATKYNYYNAQMSAVKHVKNMISIGDLQVDTDVRTCTVSAEPINLTLKEFDLLVFFMRNPGKSFTRQDILDAVWGTNLASYEHAVSTHINRLRRKIEPKLSTPTYIKTVWGVGYKFTDGTDLESVEPIDAQVSV